MSALEALAQPPSRQAQLSKAALAARRWIDAIPEAERGPLWDVLSRACDEVDILGLNDHSFLTFVKNAKRYLAYLAEAGTDQRHAFEKQVVRAYQRYVASLRKTASVPPVQPGKPRTDRPRPIRRIARGDEQRLKVSSQRDVVDAVRQLHVAARDQDATGFSSLPEVSPTRELKWRDEDARDPARIELDLVAMLAQPFVTAKGRSRCEHERNLVLAHFYCAIPTRNAELREAVWEALQVWRIAPGAKLPLERWPIEALLCGEVTLDASHVLFLTLGGAVPTKSDTFRSVPVVEALADRIQRYALAWVQAQLDTVRYLRYRARRQLVGDLRNASFDVDAIELLIAGERISAAALTHDVGLFKNAHALVGPGRLRWKDSRHKVSEAEARAFRDVLWAEAAGTRYRAALTAFERKTPIRDVFAGVFLPSRTGGVLSDDQMQHIWREMGWTTKSWTAQHLRAHAAQLFENASLAALRPLGPVIGHKDAATTRRSYAGDSPYRDVVVAEMIAEELRRESAIGVGTAGQ